MITYLCTYLLALISKLINSICNKFVQGLCAILTNGCGSTHPTSARLFSILKFLINIELEIGFHHYRQFHHANRSLQTCHGWNALCSILNSYWYRILRIYQLAMLTFNTFGERITRYGWRQPIILSGYRNKHKHRSTLSLITLMLVPKVYPFDSWFWPNDN